MIQVIPCGQRNGSVNIPSSKSVAHRLLICAGLSDKPSVVICHGLSKDILATINCLSALGASFKIDGDKINVSPIKNTIKSPVRMNTGESGSTLRFIIPIIGALGTEAFIEMEGRLPDRPLFPFDSLLCSHGMNIDKDGNILHLSGKLSSGEFRIPGNISSQFISGLLFSLPLLNADSSIIISKPVESQAYIDLTINALKKSLNISEFYSIEENEKELIFKIKSNNHYSVPSTVLCEGDWSNAAFFICMGALSDKGISLSGLDIESAQGDKKIIEIIKNVGADITVDNNLITVKHKSLDAFEIDVSLIPDLVPTLAAVASVCEGKSRIYNAARLRIKESDRLKSTTEMINNLGGSVQELSDELIINGKTRLSGGTVDSYNDHRIAMAASVCALSSDGDIIINDAKCIDKSFPDFYKTFFELQGD